MKVYILWCRYVVTIYLLSPPWSFPLSFLSFGGVVVLVFSCGIFLWLLFYDFFWWLFFFDFIWWRRCCGFCLWNFLVISLKMSIFEIFDFLGFWGWDFPKTLLILLVLMLKDYFLIFCSQIPNLLLLFFFLMILKKKIINI